MAKTFARTALTLATGLAALGSPALADASGYDTPMLYSARHMGMGGTAIGYVNDPSSLFHNPAGLGQVERGEVLGDFSLLLGGIHASPGGFNNGKNIDSDLTACRARSPPARHRARPTAPITISKIAPISFSSKHRPRSP